MLRPGSLGTWPLSLSHAGGQLGERICAPGLGGGAERRARTWTLRGDPGPGPAARAGAGAPKGGLISFPRAAEVSAQCLSHLFKFYGAWLVAAGPRPGEEAGAGSGILHRPRGGPTRQGAGQARGARTLRGARPANPSMVRPWDLPGRWGGLSWARGRGLPRRASGQAPPPFPTPRLDAPPSSPIDTAVRVESGFAHSSDSRAAFLDLQSSP